MLNSEDNRVKPSNRSPEMPVNQALFFYDAVELSARILSVGTDRNKLTDVFNEALKIKGKYVGPTGKSQTFRLPAKFFYSILEQTKFPDEMSFEADPNYELLGNISYEEKAVIVFAEGCPQGEKISFEFEYQNTDETQEKSKIELFRYFLEGKLFVAVKTTGSLFEKVPEKV